MKHLSVTISYWDKMNASEVEAIATEGEASVREF